jgi:hypothetical protein
MLWKAADLAYSCTWLSGQDFYGRLRDSMHDHGDREW